MPLPVHSVTGAFPEDRSTLSEARDPPGALEGAAFSRALEHCAPGAQTTCTVAATRTELAGDEAARALAHAWKAVTGKAPTRDTVAVLAAQWAHETGRGRHMYNYNFGGIKGVGPSGLSVVQRTREGWGCSERSIVDRFRAYRSAEEGAVDYVRLLLTRFKEAGEAAERGDAVGFVHGLKARSYFTGNPDAYARSVASLSRLALDRGTASLGPGGALPQRVDVAPYLDRTKPGFASTEVAADLGRVDLAALSDEVSRAVLTLAAQPPRRRQRDDERAI